MIDIWTRINHSSNDLNLHDHLQHDDQGFNPIYMMLDSGARGSKEQIRQLRWNEGIDG